MNDEIVEEIHQIRARLYDETKSMTTEERIAHTRAASKEVREQIAQIRAQKAAENTDARQEAVSQ